MKYISNALSLSMLPSNCEVRVTTLSDDEARAWAQAEWESCVGHTDVASLISARLGVSVEVCRKSISLVPKDQLLVGQYMGPRLEGATISGQLFLGYSSKYVGPRLPEGTTVLPEGATLSWKLVIVV